jgi:hypothetical protein
VTNLRRLFSASILNRIFGTHSRRRDLQFRPRCSERRFSGGTGGTGETWRGSARPCGTGTWHRWNRCWLARCRGQNLPA